MTPLILRQMILIIDNKDLQYEFRFNEKEQDSIQGLINTFLDKETLSPMWDSASLVLVRNGKFFYIIKNIYGILQGSLLISDVTKLMTKHLDT